MNGPNQVTERSVAIAREYRQKGYKVSVEPSPSELPDFLKNYSPDIVASSKDEIVVIEVKSRTSLSSEHEVQELARLVDAEPGWRFELVLVQDPSVHSAPHGSSPIGEQEIERFVEAADFLQSKDFDQAALVSAWSALEAAVRLRCVREDIALDQFAPDYLLKQAVTYGVISRSEYRDLRDAMNYRNAFVHGFTLEGFDRKLIRYLNDFASRIISLPTQEQ